MKATARAHTNIALIKYWGKKDPALMLPYTSSLSLTLDEFYTDTTVTFDAALPTDQFAMADAPLTPASPKINAFMDRVRTLANTTAHVQIRSTNHVPTAAGLASSASAFAALALAATTAAGLDLAPRDLSRLARRGSGSATRSIFGGLVLWHKGHDDASSFAEPLPPTDLPLRMVVVVVDAGPKPVSSRALMANTVATSPFYPAFVETNEAAVVPMKEALATNDFTRIGELTEQSSMRMHAAILASAPPFTYFQPETLAVWAVVRELQAAGVPAYVTMDAGPNVKILTLAPAVDQIRAALTPAFAGRLLVSHPGPGAEVLTAERTQNDPVH